MSDEPKEIKTWVDFLKPKAVRGFSTLKHKPKGAGRWWKLPPELHSRADEMFAKLIAKYPRDQWRFRVGLVTANVMETLLHPKDKKWSRRSWSSNGLRKMHAITRFLASEGRHPSQLRKKKRLADAEAKASKAGDTKTLDIS